MPQFRRNEDLILYNGDLMLEHDRSGERTSGDDVAATQRSNTSSPGPNQHRVETSLTVGQAMRANYGQPSSFNNHSFNQLQMKVHRQV